VKFPTITDTQGRRIASLSIPELDTLQARCEAHAAECARRGLTVKPEIAMMCAAVQYFREDSERGPIAAAFARFSEARRECIGLGYVVPPISGTPHATQIDSVTALLAQAAAAAVPLPGEAPQMTRRITDDYKQAIKNAIDLLNEKAQTGQRLQALTLPEMFKTS